MLGVLTNFIKTWEQNEAKHRKIHLLNVCDSSGHIYTIEIRYSATLFRCIDNEQFTNLVNSIGRRSGGVLRISSSMDDFNTGIISIKVAFCNHSFNEKRVTKTLRYLLEDYFSSIAA